MNRASVTAARTRAVKPAPPRPDRSAGYAKGAETRLRIILAAIDLFGEEGYERASTRKLAQMAQVNLPALQYYFTGKRGLYMACAEHISATVQAHLYPVLDRVKGSVVRNATLDQLIDGFCQLQDAIVDFTIGPAGTGKWSMFLVRERIGLGSIDGFRVMRRQMGTPYTDFCAALLGRIIGRAPTAPETLIRLNTISGQVLPFQRPESSAADSLGWSVAAKGRQTMVRRIIREQTEAILRASAAKKSPAGARGQRRLNP